MHVDVAIIFASPAAFLSAIAIVRRFQAESG
jgi:hypothetical protein